MKVKRKIYTAADETFMLPLRTLAQRMAGNLSNPFTQHGWAFAAINATATALSQVQCLAMREDRPLPDSNQLQKVMRRPNPEMDESDFIYSISASLDLYGESLLLVVNTPDQDYDPARPPRAIWPIPNPHRWEKVTREGVHVGWKDPNDHFFAARQILHIKTWNPENPDRGLAPTSPLAMALRVDHKAAAFNESFMDNGADPGGTLTSEVAISDEQQRQIRRAWEDRHQGALKRGRIAVLSNGLRYEPLTVSQTDMQFLEGRQWNREEILAVYGVPKQEVGLIDDVNRATAEVTARKWWQNRLIPRVTRIQRAFTRFFIRESGVAYEFDLSSVEALQEDLDAKIAQGQALLEMGFPLNAVNERVSLGMEDVPGGDVPLISAGKQPLELVSAGELARQAEPAERSFKRHETFAERRAYIDRLKADLFHPGEGKLLAGLRAYFRAAGRLQVKRFLVWATQTGIRADETKIVPLSPAQVNAFILSVSALNGQMTEAMEGRIGSVAALALDSVESDLGGFEVITPDLDQPYIRQIISRRMGALVRLSSGDRVLLRDVLMRKIASGGFRNIREIQTEIRRVFRTMENARALTIARTETGILANSIRFETLRQEGVEQHEWVTAGDDNVRPTDKPTPPGEGNHRAVDGQVVNIGEPFNNGLRYPNDPDGPAAEVINCRCVAVPVE